MPAPTLLRRLYTTKITVIAVALAAVGALTLAATEWGKWTWLDHDLITETASGMLTGGILAIVLEIYVSRDADARLREAIIETTPQLRDSVIAGFAATPGDLARVASPTMLDALIHNGLRARLGDSDLAADVFANVQQQIVQTFDQPHRYDAHATITLQPWDQEPRTGKGSMFVVTTEWTYSTPRHALPPLMRFAAVSDPDEYQKLIDDRTAVEYWLIYPAPDNPVVTSDDFALLRCLINGREQVAHHEADAHRQSFIITPDLGDDSDSENVHVSYTHRTLVAQYGHRLFIDFATTKGLRVYFTYSPECGIRHVDALDYTAGNRPRVEYSAPGTTRTITLNYRNNWTLYRSGVVFTWTLEREVAQR
jgi:hypothetical protein